MSIKILMPALSPTMKEGNIAKWLVKEGDKVSAGDCLAEIETDKAIMELEALDEGIMGKIIYHEGSKKVAVNNVIAVLLEQGETDVDLELVNEQSNPCTPMQLDHELDNNTHNKPQLLDSNINNCDSNGKRIFASPLAKRIAQDKNIDLSKIKGSGPNNRIVKDDVLKINNTYATNNLKYEQNNIPESYVVPNSNVRQVIGDRLTIAKQTIPHFYLTVTCNVDKLLKLRSDLNKALTDDDLSFKVSVNDFIVLSVAKTLSKMNKVNASWEGDSIRYYNSVDVSVAVSIDDGLITPIVRNADKKNIKEISLEIKDLANRARINKLSPNEYQGGGFTVSNLGMYGIDSFSAIINPPQSCILAVGASSKRPVIINDEIKIATVMDVTLSCDHRVVDGVLGAQFLQYFKKLVEEPTLLML